MSAPMQSRVRRIVHIVAEITEIPAQQILADSNNRPVVLARRIAMRYAAALGGMNCSEVDRQFGRPIGTASYSVRDVRNRIEVRDMRTCELCAAIEARLKGVV